jgi:drug/metabolite transporter (DMT)-like permease
VRHRSGGADELAVAGRIKSAGSRLAPAEDGCLRRQTEFKKGGSEFSLFFGPITTRTAGLTAVAMLAFAANSLLCREALGRHLIDAASFTAVRVIAGAVILSLIVLFRGRTSTGTTTDWRAAVMLFIYMVFFSFAYLSLSAGTGAVILFGAIQFTLFILAWRAGERFSSLSWAGIVVAVSGLIYMVLPGVTAPSPLGALSMGHLEQ